LATVQIWLRGCVKIVTPYAEPPSTCVLKAKGPFAGTVVLVVVAAPAGKIGAAAIRPAANSSMDLTRAIAVPPVYVDLRTEDSAAA
jgi:hypothetical protein